MSLTPGQTVWFVSRTVYGSIERPERMVVDHYDERPPKPLVSLKTLDDVRIGHVDHRLVFANEYVAWRRYQRMLLDRVDDLKDEVSRCNDAVGDAQGKLDDIGGSVPADLWEDIAGFVDDVQEWLCEPNPEFSGLRPLDMIGSADEGRLRRRIEAAKMGGW